MKTTNTFSKKENFITLIAFITILMTVFSIFPVFPAFSDSTNLTEIIGENLGVYGQLYSIAEPDLLAYIHTKLRSYANNGKLTAMEDHLKEKAEMDILRPKPVFGISDVTSSDQSITSYYIPSITLQHDIVDQNGKVLFHSGTIINPLDLKTTSKIARNTFIPTFDETLFFINADQSDQINFVKKSIAALLRKTPDARYKIILVKGNLKKASNVLGRIYFDQDGVLCRLLSIQRVPAIITRDAKNGARLKIVEPAI